MNFLASFFDILLGIFNTPHHRRSLGLISSGNAFTVARGDGFSLIQRQMTVNDRHLKGTHSACPRARPNRCRDGAASGQAFAPKTAESNTAIADSVSAAVLLPPMRTYLEQCFERAEAAEANANRAGDADAKRIWRATAGKWREIAQNVMDNQLSHDRWVASSVICDK